MQRNKTQTFFSRFLVVFVLLCFVGMTGYSDLLHDHDVDFSESHEDCSPCNWTKLHKASASKKVYIANVFSFSDISFQRVKSLASIVKAELLFVSCYSSFHYNYRVRGPLKSFCFCFGTGCRVSMCTSDRTPRQTGALQTCRLLLER